MKKVIVCGGGLAGINAVKTLAKNPQLDITLIDKNNYHLFQPLLYQVASGGLDPSDIAPPIRRIVYKYPNVRVLKEEALSVDLDKKELTTDCGKFVYDYLILACGSQHMYFGHNEWERYAPGLKNVEQAIEIRTRILESFELAERDNDAEDLKKYMNLVIVGGGPTGVELAGALAEMVKYTLVKDFRNIDPEKTNIYLIEAMDRILPMFSESMADQAKKYLETLGVKVLAKCPVTEITENYVKAGGQTINTATVIWAAGVKAVDIGFAQDIERDKRGRIAVQNDLSIKGHPEVFVIGDQSHCEGKEGKLVPGVATAALQEGTFVGGLIREELKGKTRDKFKYFDKGEISVIGRGRAIMEVGKYKFRGFIAWVVWAFVHIWYLTGFENRTLVLMQWFWSYLFYSKGARLILKRDWRFYTKDPSCEGKSEPANKG